MLIFKAVWCGICLLIVPYLAGTFAARTADVDRLCRPGAEQTFLRLLSGYVLSFAVLLLPAEPLILLKAPLVVLTVVWALLVGGAAFAGALLLLRDRQEGKRSFPAGSVSALRRPELLVPLVLILLLFCFEAYRYVFMTHIDDDDSRFVVNAVDAWQQGTMYLTNPATGVYDGSFAGERLKDVTAPYAMYYAALARLTGIHPTILFHTVLPPILLLLMYIAIWLFGAALSGRDRERTAWFTFFAGLLLLFFAGSTHTIGEFALARIWQGKAVAGAVMIPLYWAFYIREWRNRHGFKGRRFLALFCMNMASVLLSGVGLLLCGIFTGLAGLWDAVLKKSLQPLVPALVCEIPVLLVGAVQLLLR